MTIFLFHFFKYTFENKYLVSFKICVTPYWSTKRKLVYWILNIFLIEKPKIYLLVKVIPLIRGNRWNSILGLAFESKGFYTSQFNIFYIVSTFYKIYLWFLLMKSWYKIENIKFPIHCHGYYKWILFNCLIPNNFEFEIVLLNWFVKYAL